MKRLIFAVLAVMVMAMPMANAQKVNKSAVLAKLEKADASIADAKKNTKAATWVARANAYTNAYILPTKEVGRGVPVQVLQMNVGQPSNVYEGEFRGTPVYVCDYEYVDIYVDAAGLIQGWNQKKAIKENLPQTAIESMAKAYEMDPKQESKIASIALTLSNALAQQGCVPMSI